MTEVALDWYEYSMAYHVGGLRTVESIRKGKKRPDGTTTTADEDVEGAAAEMAVAKHLDLYWSGSVNAFVQPDLGGFHVRQASQHHLRMPIRPRDYDKGFGDDPFIFVTGRRRNYAIRGWTTPNSVTDVPFSDPHGWGPVRLVRVDRLTALSEL